MADRNGLVYGGDCTAGRSMLVWCRLDVGGCEEISGRWEGGCEEGVG